MTFGILRTDNILRTGELPHHILHFADRDALGGAPNRSAKLDVLWTVSGKTAHVVGLHVGSNHLKLGQVFDGTSFVLLLVSFIKKAIIVTNLSH